MSTFRLRAPSWQLRVALLPGIEVTYSSYLVFVGSPKAEGGSLWSGRSINWDSATWQVPAEFSQVPEATRLLFF